MVKTTADKGSKAKGLRVGPVPRRLMKGRKMQRSMILIALFVLLPASAIPQEARKGDVPRSGLENTMDEKTVELAPMLQGEQLAKDGEEDR